MKITHLTAAIGLAIAPVLFAAPARSAPLFHAWVASNGDDTFSCDRSAPCATFTGAFGKTAAGGEITCVDSGNYAGLFIDKSITINCEAAIGSNAQVGGGGVNNFFIATAATDIVTLRGLDLDGLGFFGGGALVNFNGAGVLHLHKVKISNARGVGSNGIAFNPTGAARLFVSDSTITDNGRSGVDAGILIKPAAGIPAEVTINRTQIEHNFFGIVADGTAGGTINGVVRDSVVSGNVNFGIAQDKLCDVNRTHLDFRCMVRTNGIA